MDRNKRMIYSPKERIPIGEAVITENGIHGIRVKRKRKTGNAEEFISVDKIQELIIAIKKENADTP